MHQLPVIALTVGVFVLEVIPLELQRRAVNDITKHRPYTAIILICAAYLGAIAIQGSAKLCLNLYGARIGERAKRQLRRRIRAILGAAGEEAASPDVQGTAIAMLVAEVELVGRFVGASLSEPLLQIGILATVIAYITHVDLWMGIAACCCSCLSSSSCP